MSSSSILQDAIAQQLLTNHDSRAHVAFVSGITLAYRNLYEQSDSGAILTPEQFVELLLLGATAIRSEARVSTLTGLCPNPSTIDEKKLVNDYLLTSVKTVVTSDSHIAKFATALNKLVLSKGTTTP